MELSLAQKAMLEMGSVLQGGGIKLPTTEEFERKHPHLSLGDDDWKVVSRMLLKVEKEMGGRIIRGTMTNKAKEGNVAVGVEARIIELKGEALIEASKRNGVKIEIHPTNGGITAMRRKNALLTLFRHGNFKQAE